MTYFTSHRFLHSRVLLQRYFTSNSVQRQLRTIAGYLLNSCVGTYPEHCRSEPGHRASVSLLSKHTPVVSTDDSRQKRNFIHFITS